MIVFYWRGSPKSPMPIRNGAVITYRQSRPQRYIHDQNGAGNDQTS
ncbi:hypothetical protein A8926_6811 [Saccharopolyspora spinosa]|uniref:Uncharacterized protein n=1 Tax=Saccharopolyspora spinosa TaxID=60894 RepID=A0A2N3Y738_SACSN|nr:hypothetical protein A8926_6811 [Saccharopolyspora spinosa]